MKRLKLLKLKPPNCKAVAAAQEQAAQMQVAAAKEASDKRILSRRR